MTPARSLGLWIYVALIGLAGAAVHWYGVLPASRGLGEPALPWLVVVTVGFFLTERFVVHLRLGSEAFAFSMMEIPLVLGLFFVRPDLLLVCRLLGGGLALVLQRKAARKVAFNVALFLLETSAALAVFNVVVGDHDRLSPWGWLATGAAVLCTSMLGSTLVSGAISIASGQLPRSAGEVVSLGQVGDLANACFALVAVYLVSADWRAAWLLAVLAAVLVFAHHSYEGARRRSESLARVNRFTELVGREVELEAVVGTVLTEVRAAFGAREVHLRLLRADVLPGPEGPQDRAHRDGPDPGDDRQQDWRLAGEAPHREWSPLADTLVARSGGEALLVPRRTRVPELVTLLAGAGVRDCVLVPLRSEGQAVGSLVVVDKLGEVETFTAADVEELGALANHAAVAIDNALRARLIVAAAEERERRAMYDDLTGLPNRKLLGLMLQEALASGPAAVLLLDLDRFKEVNDTLGHEVGDRLLCLVADRLVAALEPGTSVARLAGDEFAVVLPGADDLRAAACASLLQEALARPFDLDGIAVAVDAGIGLVPAAFEDEVGAVLRRADLALDVAKHRRTGVEVYRPSMERHDTSRLALLADLRAAVSANALSVHYQPKVDIGSGRVVGVEALARWEHPEHGRIGPDEFIPLAEHSSLITPLTMLVLRTALRDTAVWRRSHDAELTVAVNISPRSLLDPRFVDDVARALAYAGVPSGALTLEITETSLMTEPDRAIEALLRLRELGVRLSVDDLGTGYSSLAYLQRLPVDEIKVDRSFIGGFPDPSSQAVVGAIVELGHRLGHRVVAEGVEDEDGYALLRRLGCDSAQGFWLARPAPADDVGRVLENWSPPRTAPLRRVR